MAGQGEVLSVGRPEPVARPKLISNSSLGMLLFIFTEVMFFAGLVSGYMVVKSRATGGWPPPGQPQLPFEETAINTSALLASGFVLLLAHRAWQHDRVAASRRLGIAILLGTSFVVFQGFEWVNLLREGLTLTSSAMGSFFYTIVGTHALHSVVALGAMVWAWLKLRKGTLSNTAFATVQLFWYFVVLLWPFLYFKVYP